MCRHGEPQANAQSATLSVTGGKNLRALCPACTICYPKTPNPHLIGGSDAVPVMNSVAARRENRRHERHRYTALPTQVRALAGTGVLPVTVRDLSRSGIGLLCSQPIPTPKPLMIEVYNHAEASWQLHAAWTVHCTERRHGEWLVGVRFCAQVFAQCEDRVVGQVVDRQLEVGAAQVAEHLGVQAVTLADALGDDAELAGVEDLGGQIEAGVLAVAVEQQGDGPAVLGALQDDAHGFALGASGAFEGSEKLGHLSWGIAAPAAEQSSAPAVFGSDEGVADVHVKAYAEHGCPPGRLGRWTSIPSVPRTALHDIRVAGRRRSWLIDQQPDFRPHSAAVRTDLHRVRPASLDKPPRRTSARRINAATR